MQSSRLRPTAASSLQIVRPGQASLHATPPGGIRREAWHATHPLRIARHLRGTAGDLHSRASDARRSTAAYDADCRSMQAVTDRLPTANSLTTGATATRVHA